MEKEDNKEQARDGVEVINDSTTRSSGHSVSFVHGSSCGNASSSSGNTFGTCIRPSDLRRTQNNITGERSNITNVQYHSSSAYATAANTNSKRRRRSVSSSPYSSMSHEALPVDHPAERSNGAAFSKSKVFVHGSSSCQAPPANDELKLIENIADTLSPDEVRHLLFQGHKNEHIAYPFLNPNIESKVSSTQGHQNDINVVGHQQLPPLPQPTDFRTICIYCYKNVLDGNTDGNTSVSKRSCGHYFHVNCFHLQPESKQNIWIKDCHFCELEKNR
ncbi:uncharacterized protein LOC122654996 [Telopea speciosissima]|uniref:uncharacterized protein LOC122654996 n=1 Tax=Telopea speciosissima TaxID=54955 RepID=UPI001CC5F146|nr:uncharacterized protein LOC122654996 [Telopea speciosissima]